MRTVPLSIGQHCFCIAVSAFSIPWFMIIKAVLPLRIFRRVRMNEKEMTEEESRHSFTASFKKSFRDSHKSFNQSGKIEKVDVD